MQVLEQLKHLDDERFLRIYESLQQQGFGPLDAEVAKALRFRPQAVRKLPMAQRARRARTLLQRNANAELAYELFGGYLMQHCKELVTGFLDATGVEHDDGMIESLEEQRPDPAKIPDAVRDLDGRFDPQDVTLYLALCAEQWSSMPEVQAAWRERLPAVDA